MALTIRDAPAMRARRSWSWSSAEYRIEIHLGGSVRLTLRELDAALRHAQELLAALP
jgi:hypothetical protein